MILYVTVAIAFYSVCGQRASVKRNIRILQYDLMHLPEVRGLSVSNLPI